MDAGVALARRLRNYLDAGIEDLRAGHQELGLAAAEQRREERAEMAVDAFEGLAQQLARLAVDAPDRVLERLRRLVQVCGLRIEIGFALAAGAQLLDRRQVDGAKLADRLGDARDLALQCRGPRRALCLGLQPFLVGASLAKLRRELLVVQRRGLFLQPQLALALAQRRELGFDLQPCLLDLAQRACGRLDRIARARERFLAGDARFDTGVQRLAHRRDRIGGGRPRGPPPPAG